MSQSTLYVIDDNPIVCQSLVWLFKATSDISVVSYSDAESFLKEYNLNCNGCLLLDILLPNMSGLQLLKELRERGNKMPIIVFTGKEDVATAVEAMRLGARDFITKPFSSKTLLEKVRIFLTDYAKQHALQQRYLTLFSTLTTREWEVMKLVIAGKLSKQIAVDCNISQKTVDLHRFNIMHKLEVNTVADLIHINYILNFTNNDIANRIPCSKGTN